MSIQITMGPYLVQSQKGKVKRGMCNWYQKLEDKKVIFPEDHGMIPDVVVYLSTGEY